MSFFDWLLSLGNKKHKEDIQSAPKSNAKNEYVTEVSAESGTKLEIVNSEAINKRTVIPTDDKRQIEKKQETKTCIEKPTAKHEKQNDTLRAVLIAKSGKGGGACVAAYCQADNRIVRFVSNPYTGAEIPFSDLANIKELDIVEVDNPKTCPIGHHTENVYIRRYGIKKVGHFNGTIEDIRKAIVYDDKESIANTSADAIYNINGFKHSLEVVGVKDLHLRKASAADGRTTTRADFLYNGHAHKNYRVTDFTYDLRKSEENHMYFPSADLVLSIPKETYIYNNKDYGYYKFVAAIFPIDEPVKYKSTENENQKKGISARAPVQEDPKRNAYEPWSVTEDEKLKTEFHQGLSVSKIAELHGRSYGAIRARLKRQGLIEK